MGDVVGLGAGVGDGGGGAGAAGGAVGVGDGEVEAALEEAPGDAGGVEQVADVFRGLVGPDMLKLELAEEQTSSAGSASLMRVRPPWPSAMVAGLRRLR